MQQTRGSVEGATSYPQMIGWRRATKIRPAHVAIGLRAAAWLLVSRVVLWVGGFRTLSRMLGFQTIEPAERESGEYPVLSKREGRTLFVTLWLLDLKVLRVGCLPRAVVIERALAWRGLPGDVVIGVDTANGFKAHAWVEVNGYPVGAGEHGSRAWKALGRFRSTKTGR